MSEGAVIFLGIVRLFLAFAGLCVAVYVIDRRWGRRLRKTLLKGVRG